MKNYLKIFSIFIFLVNFSFAQTIIGKSDYIDLPTLNIKNIKAKIDFLPFLLEQGVFC